MLLKEFVKKLESFAPTKLAGSWDNVGLLIEPSAPKTIRKVILTNDLTEKVMEEATDKNVDMIISYHPPIFRPLKRLTSNNWKERIVVKCIENRIALFSPHTSYDSVFNGVTDWLISPYGPGLIKPITPKTELNQGLSHSLTISGLTPTDQNDGIIPDLLQLSASVEGIRLLFNDERSEVVVTTNSAILNQCVDLCRKFDKSDIRVVKLEPLPIPGTGDGRTLTLEKELSLSEAVELTKKHLQLKNVRLAETTEKKEIKTIAVCAGAGTSVLSGVRNIDLWITGEMSHHEVLDAVHNGTNVILCDHSNTERGFLKVLKQRFENDVFNGNQIEFYVSETDKDPLTIV